MASEADMLACAAEEDRRSKRDHAEGSAHRREYDAALLMCEAHASIWTPEVSA